MTVEKDSLKAWVENWARVGPVLEKRRRQELREFSHEDRWRVVDALFELGVRCAKPRQATGMVEMQRLFQKAREHERTDRSGA